MTQFIETLVGIFQSSGLPSSVSRAAGCTQ